MTTDFDYINTTDIKQRRPLAIHQRGQRTHEPYVRTNTRLLPRDTFKGHPDVLAAYDKMATLLEAIQHQTNEIRRCNRESEAAAEKYRLEIREALATGKDPDKITNKSAGLTTQANEHQALLRRATGGAEIAGRELGQAIMAATPAVFEPVEKNIDAADAKVRRALDALNKSLTEWGEAWQTRRILSNMHLFGGPLINYEPEHATPKEIGTAVALITDQLSNLERIKADEAQLGAERAKDAGAQAHLNRGPHA